MHPHSTDRSGFTLIEFTIALSLALLVSGITLTLLHQHQHTERDVTELLRARTRVREATALLAADLRGANPNDSIYLAADTAVELFTTLGVSLLCTTPTSTTVALPPDSSTGPTPSALLTVPDSADALSLFHDSTSATPSRGWSRYAIVRVTRPLAAAVCPPSSTFTTAADIAVNRHSYELLLATSLPATARAGAPLRVIRRARYSLYRAADAHWYLGYRRCSAAGCGAIQPVSGPYGGAAPPLQFKYYDGNGNEIIPVVPGTTIARIDVVAHAATPNPITIPGSAPGIYTDSSVTSIALRNAQ